MTDLGRPLLLLVIPLALVSGCRNEIWLSEPDGLTDLDAGHDASAPRDANDVDAGHLDADLDVGMDAAPPVDRACEASPVTLAVVDATDPLEAPTFAASGRLATLRYALLVPPSASTTATDDTRLIVFDDEGVVLHDRTFLVEDATGTVTSRTTLHALSPQTDDEGFLLLSPGALQMLDRDGASAASPVLLATPPSAASQRASGWLDADRFVFVSDTPDLLLAVFDRTTGAVTTTSISATNAAVVHIEPGGVTISSGGPTSDVVVYDPDLSGAETLRTVWEDSPPSLLGNRLLGTGLFAGERTWLVQNTCEFRVNVTSYRIAMGEAPAAGPMTPSLCPLTATREGPFVAIVSGTPAVVLYDFEAHAFSTIATGFTDTPIVEDERDGENVAVLFLVPATEGNVSLDLSCGRH